MSRNLTIVQKISKVLGILSKIGFIMSIVGLVCCIVGLVLSVVGGLSMEFAQKFVKAELENNITMKQVTGYCLSGLVVCIVSVIVTKAHKDYFEMEQKVGTPFTAEGAKSFRTLGIMNIVAPLINVVAVAIVNSIFKIRFEYTVDGSMGVGIAMILISFVLAYGAELESKKVAE